MNQTIRQKQAVLQVLRERLKLSTSEMYQKIGKDEPVRAPRFNVVPLGRNVFDIVDRTSGLSRGARSGHDNACSYAKQLERKADFISSTRATGAHFGRMLIRGTLFTVVVLTAFAYYGVQR